jgi:hypothetical protein
VHHSRTNSYHYDITCKNDGCSWTIQSKLDNRVIPFDKQDLLEADMIRINSDGEYMDTSKMKLQEQNKLGHSIRLRMRVPAEEGSKLLKVEKTFVFTPVNTGRRSAREGVKKIMNFIGDKSVSKPFSYSRTSHFTLIGALSTFMGLVALVLVILLGKWREQIPPGLTRKGI